MSRGIGALTAIGVLTLGVACSTAPAPSARPRESVANVLDAYVAAMKTGDYGKVTFAPDVTFVGPLTNGPINGEAAVRAFLVRVSTDVKDIRVKRQVIDGEFACVVGELESRNGTVVPYIEYFRVVDGRIREIHPYFDPRPLIR